jgi:hypothetical protein
LYLPFFDPQFFTSEFFPDESTSYFKLKVSPERKINNDKDLCISVGDLKVIREDNNAANRPRQEPQEHDR